MQFKDIIGQSRLQSDLVQIAENGRTHHTQLFVGNRGQGVLPFMMAYAQFLQCEQPVDGDSCGECISCQKMSKMGHPDVRYSFPTVTKKNVGMPTSEDYIQEFRTFFNETPYGDLTEWLSMMGEKKNGKIRASECLEIIKTARYKKLEGKYKLNIIWLPELLGTNGNRLLKILEEPPEDTIFLLGTEHEESILNTILSRTQIHRLLPISQQDLQRYLEQKHSISSSQAKQIALICNDNIHQANRIAETIHDNHESVMVNWFQTIFQNKQQLVDFVSDLSSKSNDELKNLFLHATQLCRETLILRDSNLQARLPESEQKVAHWLGRRLDLQSLHQLTSLFEDAIYAIDRNVNTNVLLMSLSLEIDEIIRQQKEAVS